MLVGEFVEIIFIAAGVTIVIYCLVRELSTWWKETKKAIIPARTRKK